MKLIEVRKKEEAKPKFIELPNPPNPKHKQSRCSNINADLLCQFCDSLANDPVQCTNCDILFCAVDIKGWLKKSENCPNCSEKFIPYKRINKLILNALAETKKRENAISLPYGSSIAARHRQCAASPDKNMYYCNFPGCVYDGFNDY